jgi:hypothetical protein
MRVTIREVEIVVEPEPVAGIVLANLEWLIRNRDARVDLTLGMVFIGDGGCDIECLADPGCTPARRLAA